MKRRSGGLRPEFEPEFDLDFRPEFELQQTDWASEFQAVFERVGTDTTSADWCDLAAEHVASLEGARHEGCGCGGESVCGSRTQPRWSSE